MKNESVVTIWQRVNQFAIENKYEALIYFNKFLEQNPTHYGALLGKGKILINLGKSEEAIQYFDKLLEKDPSDALALGNKGVELSNHNKSKKQYIILEKP